MQEIWNNLMFILERFTWSSVLDILLVTIFFSLLLYLLRDTDAQTLLRGIFLIVILVFLLTSLVNCLPSRGLFKPSHPLLSLQCRSFLPRKSAVVWNEWAAWVNYVFGEVQEARELPWNWKKP